MKKLDEGSKVLFGAAVVVALALFIILGTKALAEFLYRWIVSI